MGVDVLSMFESLAEHGTAPEEGCSLFGVGYESAFERLEARYLVDRFSRGGCAEKFVIGPFGSGKTHFLRQLMEVGRNNDCVTAEVKLNKNLDYAQGLVVYQEIARQLRAPGQENHGLRAVVLEAVRRIRHEAEAAGLPPEDVLAAWVAALAEQDFALPAFGRVLQRSLQDHLRGADEGFEAGIRWLAGEVTDRSLAKKVDESPITSSEYRIHAHHARLSLYRFIRHAGFRGTIVGFDEAEQGIAVEKKKMAKIFSQLLAEINSIIDAKDTAVLIVYAVTPDVMAKIDEDMPMLRSRLGDPGGNQGFFDGNTLAPRIDLTKRLEPREELEKIGNSLVSLFFDRVPDADAARRGEAVAAVAAVAAEVERDESSSSARREMVKRTCAPLVNQYRTVAGARLRPPTLAREAEV